MGPPPLRACRDLPSGTQSVLPIPGWEGAELSWPQLDGAAHDGGISPSRRARSPGAKPTGHVVSMEEASGLGTLT